MKEFERLYRLAKLEDFWEKFKPTLWFFIPMAVLLILVFFNYSTSHPGELDMYIGEVKGVVTKVYNRQTALDNPRIIRRVRIEIENGSHRVMLNDTLQVGDEVVLSHWKTTKGNDYYGL